MNSSTNLRVLTGLLCLFPLSSQAIETYNITIKDHKFSPTEVKLLVKNLDATPEEFESYELHREKIIRGNSQATIFLGPLKTGSYRFFGEFNPKTAQGHITVK